MESLLRFLSGDEIADDGIGVTPSIPIAAALAAFGGILEVFATAVLAYPAARMLEGFDWSDMQLKGCLAMNIILQILASLSGNLFATWFGPVAIVGPMFFAAQLLANLVVFWIVLGLESFSREMQIGTYVIVVAVILLIVNGPGSQNYDDTSFQELLSVSYAMVWGCILLIGMLISGLIVIVDDLHQRPEWYRLVALLIARASAFSLNLSTGKALVLETNQFWFVMNLCLKILSGIIYTRAIVVQSTAVQQKVFVPLNAAFIILLNAMTGVLIWRDGLVVQSWVGYVCVFLLLVLGCGLLLGDFGLLQETAPETFRGGQPSMFVRDGRRQLLQNLKNFGHGIAKRTGMMDGMEDVDDECEYDDGYEYDGYGYDSEAFRQDVDGDGDGGGNPSMAVVDAIDDHNNNINNIAEQWITSNNNNNNTTTNTSMISDYAGAVHTQQYHTPETNNNINDNENSQQQQQQQEKHHVRHESEGLHQPHNADNRSNEFPFRRQTSEGLRSSGNSGLRQRVSIVENHHHHNHNHHQHNHNHQNIRNTSTGTNTTTTTTTPIDATERAKQAWVELYGRSRAAPRISVAPTTNGRSRVMWRDLQRQYVYGNIHNRYMDRSLVVDRPQSLAMANRSRSYDPSIVMGAAAGATTGNCITTTNTNTTNVSFAPSRRRSQSADAAGPMTNHHHRNNNNNLRFPTVGMKSIVEENGDEEGASSIITTEASSSTTTAMARQRDNANSGDGGIGDYNSSNGGDGNGDSDDDETSNPPPSADNV